ncbi:Uncharacterised protein [Mycobacteroides abscessus subsp. abscessus]|nr:Uncharacterised protein [Mycobacteroides abscessus subsp. abscessus]
MLLNVLNSIRTSGNSAAARDSPIATRATLSAPYTGRRAALTLPPPSDVQTASGASISTSASTSPPAAASRNLVVSSSACRSVGVNRRRRDCTCARARCAIWRTATSDLPTVEAISE